MTGPRLFEAAPDRPDPFPTPDFLFAACEHEDSRRPVETVTPVARKLKLAIDDRYDNKLAKPGTRHARSQERS